MHRGEENQRQGGGVIKSHSIIYNPGFIPMMSKSKISNKKNPIHPESRSSFESVRSMRNQANNIKTETETFSRIWDKKRGKTYPFLKTMKRFLFNFFFCFLPFFYLPNSVGNKLVSFLFSLCETDLTKTRKRKRRTKQRRLLG